MAQYKQDFKTINLSKVKYLTMTRLSALLIEQGAIIFGGFVRDMIIHNHYALAFYDNSVGQDKYDDESYDTETKHRLLVPNDIDVFVKGNEEEVGKLYEFIRTKGFFVEIKKRRAMYSIFDNIYQHKIVIKTQKVTGLPSIKIDLDILYSSEDNIKPPFKRLDLLCNSLLLDNNGITVSDQTGTRFDLMNHFERKLLEKSILDDLLTFDTQKVLLVEQKDADQMIKNKEIIYYRIQGMVERGWKVKGYDEYEDSEEDDYETQKKEELVFDCLEDQINNYIKNKKNLESVKILISNQSNKK